MSMRLAVTALVVLLVGSACAGTAPTPARPSQSASTPVAALPTSTAVASASAEPSAVALPTSSLPLVALGFSCRLPVVWGDYSLVRTPLQVGFWSLPEGGISLSAAPPDPYPVAFDYYYDRAFSRWLPVPRRAVSPDGTHYAYAPYENDRVIHVVDVASGRDQAYPAIPAAAATSPAHYYVIDYANEGIYLALGYEGPNQGLWLMDPNTGAIRRVADVGDVKAVDGSAVWLGSVNPADPSPVPGLGVQPDSLDRFDLVTGSKTTWLYRPGMGIGFIGLDRAGHPIVEAQTSSPTDDMQLLLLTGPDAAKLLFRGPWTELNGNSGEFGNPMADSHGVWFGSAAGIYLYSPEDGLRKVSDLAAYPGNGCI